MNLKRSLMMLLASLTIPTGMLWSLSAFADNYTQDDCPEIDMRAEFGPTRSQDDIGWCFANSAADMLSYHYKRILNGQRASAGYVALAFNEAMRHPPTREGGDMNEAFRASVKRGICPENGETSLIDAGPKEHLREKLQGLVDFKTLFDEAQFSPARRDEFKAQLQRLIATKSKLMTALPRKQLAQLLVHSTEDSFPMTVADKFCENVRVKPDRGVPELQSVSKESFPFSLNVQPQIDVLLRSGHPVAIGYISDFLQSPTWTETVNIRPWNARKLINGAHSSLLVGQHWNSHRMRCEYILRNSWGQSCNPYPNPELGGPENCQAGNLFIDKTYLEKHIFDVQWVATPRGM